MLEQTMPSDPRPNGSAAQADSTPQAARVPDLNEALGELEVELERLRSAAEQIEASKQTAHEAIEAARSVGGAAVALVGPTQALVERLDKVDFPTRLDKVDATVSALGMGLQNVQGRLDGVERGIKDDLGRLRGDVERGVAEASLATVDAVAQHAQNVRDDLKQVRILLFVALAALVGVIALSLIS